MGFWTSGGKVIVADGLKFVNCDECPCCTKWDGIPPNVMLEFYNIEGGDFDENDEPYGCKWGDLFKMIPFSLDPDSVRVERIGNKRCITIGNYLAHCDDDYGEYTTKVDFSFTRNGKHYSYRIIDDGCGYDSALWNFPDSVSNIESDYTLCSAWLDGVYACKLIY